MSSRSGRVVAVLYAGVGNAAGQTTRPASLRSERPSQARRWLRTAGVVRIGCDEDACGFLMSEMCGESPAMKSTSVLVHLQILAHKLNSRIRIFH
jgi:hypothetical protein